MTPDRRNPQRTPSQADPDGALERLLQRRHLKFQEGDVIITRQAGGLRAESRAVYHLHVHGTGPLQGALRRPIFYLTARGTPPCSAGLRQSLGT